MINKKVAKIGLIASCLLLGVSSIFSQGTMLLRQPAANAQYIVFCHADDLWRVDIKGGNAIRLTSAIGSESNPSISPDGNWVAFSGRYYGNIDVYVIPITGGDPKRLTWHPGNDIVQGWLPNTQEIFFSSGREGYPTASTRFYTVKLSGGTPTAMKIPYAATGSISSDGETMAYIPYQLWDTEWRNYKGGQAQPISIIDLKTMKTVKTQQADRERHGNPVWYHGTLFFLSEQDFVNNIWSYDPKTKVQKQITFYKDFDIKNLAVGGDQLIYEHGGTLHSYTISTAKIEDLVIHVKGDFNWNMPRWNSLNGMSMINASLSPTGKRALFESRGDIFTVPKEMGDWRNITQTVGSADRYPVWSPDGLKIAWFSDISGEYQLMIGDQDGVGQPKSYSLPNQKFYYTPAWSADGKYISFTDTDYNIWNLQLATGVVKKVDTDLYANPLRVMKPVWSPDSKWIAYVKQLPNQFKAVHVYHVETGKVHQLTDGLSDAIDPQWDESGKYLYFLASTDFGLNAGWLDMSSFNYPVNRTLYAIVLNKKTPMPIALRSDDEPLPPDTTKQQKPAVTSNQTKGGVEVDIDFDEIHKRIVSTNVPLRNYLELVGGPNGSVFCVAGSVNSVERTVYKFTLADQKLTEFVKGDGSFSVSFDRKNLLYRSGFSWHIINTSLPPRPGEGRIRTDLMKVYVDPAKEAEQIFKEGWRFQRDFLYVSNLHGAPWNKVYEWYAPWIKHVKHRSDLNYVMDILGGEVSVGHSFTFGGDLPVVEGNAVGLLGADYAVENGLFKIKKIYTGENWNPDVRSPLGVPNLSVQEGDYLLEVDGKKLDASMNVFSLFEGTANRQVKIKVNEKPAMEGARLITVVPVTNESQLRLRYWVESNRKKVDELSNGKLAYVYVPNTQAAGYTYFNRYYFSQQDKQGAVIDERDNGGGYVADYIVDVLNRKLLGYFNNRIEGHRPSTTPMAGIWGPKVMIINGNAGSGGDMLPYMFRKLQIGPLIGKRTWGGLVGTWDTPSFMDGGTMIAPRSGFFDTDGKWAVEAEGVAPDIDVELDPSMVVNGRDTQLERAVKEAMQLLSKEKKLMKEPEAPIRYFRPKGK